MDNGHRTWRMRSTNLKRIFYTHFTLWRLSNNLLLSSSVGLNVISSVRHPTKDILRQYRVPVVSSSRHRSRLSNRDRSLSLFCGLLLQSYRCRLPLSSMSVSGEKERLGDTVCVLFTFVGMFGCQIRHQHSLDVMRRDETRGGLQERRYMRDSKPTRHG